MTPIGWGGGDWGETPWGSGEVIPPVVIVPLITPLDPVDGDVAVPQHKVMNIRITDDVGVVGSSMRVSVNGIDFVLYGAAVGGASLVQTVNAGNGFDLEITSALAFDYGSEQEVFVSATNVDGNPASLTYRFYVGVGLRILQVRNPMENVLLAHFNKSMKLDTDFYAIGNWVVTPVTEGAAPIEIVEITSNARQPDQAHLRYTGGGSTYLLTVYNVMSQAGESIEHGYNSIEFDLIYGAEETPTVRLFDSVYGPLGISQQTRRRRTMDDHTSDRAVALALDEQFRLRLQQLDGTIGRTGKPGIRRT